MNAEITFTQPVLVRFGCTRFGLRAQSPPHVATASGHRMDQKKPAHLLLFCNLKASWRFVADRFRAAGTV